MKHKLILLFLAFTQYFYQIQASSMPKPAPQSRFNEAAMQKYMLSLEWFAAAEKQDLNKMRELIGKVDVNGVGMDHRTALMQAICHGNREMVQFLLQLPDIDINKKNPSGNTALMHACEISNLEIVQLLLQKATAAKVAIDINAQDEFGNTALIMAIPQYSLRSLFMLGLNGRTDSKGDKEWDERELIVKLLLDVPGINLNIQNQAGLTALKAASRSKNEPIAKLIQNKIDQLTCQAFEIISGFAKAQSEIENQSKITVLKTICDQIGDNIVDKDGRTLLDKAFESNKPEIVLFLLFRAKDPRELLARFPFELVNPSSEIFNLCMELAYIKHDSATLATPIIEKDSAKLCGNCAKSDCRKKCGRCKKVYYCSADCQKQHWSLHKHSCTAI